MISIFVTAFLDVITRNVSSVCIRNLSSRPILYVYHNDMKRSSHRGTNWTATFSVGTSQRSGPNTVFRNYRIHEQRSTFAEPDAKNRTQGEKSSMLAGHTEDFIAFAK